MSTLLQNVRLALRRLARSPGFTAVATLTLALGIGANTAIFSVVDAALFRPLPFPDADRVARVYAPAHAGRGAVSAPDFADYQRDSRAFSTMAAISQGTFTLSGNGATAEQRDGASVTEDFFRVLGVGPALGRGIGPDDARVGAPPVVVLSDGVWKRRFGGDRDIVGKSITVDGVSTTVIGVMPPRFDYPVGASLWTPLAFDEKQLTTQRGAHYLDVIGRLRPGTTVDAARADVGAIQTRLAAAFPTTNLPGPASLVTLRESLTGDARPALLVLLGAVGLLLLVACANVANLLLARAIGRQREIAVRTALGASRGRIARELLAEAVTLAVAGGAVGLLLAVWGTTGLGVLLPDDHLLASASIDGRMLVATLALSVLTGLLFGLFPALQLTPTRDLGAALAGGGRGASSSAAAQRAKRALAVAEVALSVVLLTGAGLLLRSFVALNAVDPGFATEQRLTFGISLPAARYDTNEKSAAFVDDLLNRLKAMPGVESAGLTMGLPLTDFRFAITAHSIDGRELENAEQDRITNQIRVVTPDWFRAMAIPMKRGRGITEADRWKSPNVVVLSESAAKLAFGDVDPIGHEFVIGTTFGLGRGRAGGTVVGVVADVLDAGLARPASPTVYLSYDQYPVGGGIVVVHTRGVPPTSIIAPARAALAALDPDVPLFEPRTMADVAAASIARPRFLTTLLGLFAGVAAVLAAIGLYGVIAYAVGERTREIGIRVALGAASGDVLRLVLRGGLALAVAGIAIGLAGSVATSRLLRSLLYGVGPFDVATFATTAVAVLAVALLATWLPARRAARLDPVEALRVE